MSYTPPATGQQPTSFKTNVNRSKTKRWVEAKSYSYDGDDWGEVDDYDEYGGYDEPAPPSGIRPRGHSTNQPIPGFREGHNEEYQSPDNARHGYGDLGGQPVMQQPHGLRSMTNPPPRVDPKLERSNSFDRGDERRAFSAGDHQQCVTASGPELYQVPVLQQGVNQASPQQGGNWGPSLQQELYQQPLPQEDPYQVTPSHRAPFKTSEPQPTIIDNQSISSSFYYGPERQDILYPEQSPHPNLGGRTQSMASSNSSMQHPPRKSSLSQGNQPNIAISNQVPQVPQVPPSEEFFPLDDREGKISSNEPLAFVRPADIYRRMQEEKDKERRSLDSERPRINAQVGRSTAGTLLSLHEPGRLMPNPGNLGSRSTLADVIDNAKGREPEQRSRQSLDSTGERKIEDGADENRVAEGSDARRAHTSSVSTLRPILPDVTRISGFGDLLLDTTSNAKNQSPTVSQEPVTSFPQSISQAPSQSAADTSLQHQTSSGFRSVVAQAFDRTNDQIPATPSSTAGSGIGRSTSGSTSVISPIISRGPSMAKAAGTAAEVENRASTPPVATKENEVITPRPISSTTLGTPKQITRKPSPSASPLLGFNEPIPSTFIPGHRRDLSTPSPENSPARIPILQTARQIQKPQRVELAMTSPVEVPLSPEQVSQVNELQRNEGERVLSLPVCEESISKPSPTMHSRQSIFGASNPIDTGKHPGENIAAESPATPLDDPTHSRAESPSKNRVRDLAGKFESGRTSRAGSELSAGSPGRGSPRKETMPLSRPLADRLESFRPHFPGGWDSYTSAVPPKASTKRNSYVETEQPEPKEPISVPEHVEDPFSTTVPEQVAPLESSNKSSDLVGIPSDLPMLPKTLGSPFAAVSAAGSSLAMALVAAVSADSKEPDAESSGASSQRATSADCYMASPRHENTSVDTSTHPEAPRPLDVTSVNDEESSVAPTPPLKDFPPKPSDAQATSTGTVNLISEDHPSRNINSAEDVAHSRPQPMLLPISTDIRSQQYESDRLRREIVKNLSPRGISEPTTGESDSPWLDDSGVLVDPSLTIRGHDSMVIPTEYDSYWNGSDSGGENSQANSDHGKVDLSHPHEDDTIKAPQPLHIASTRSSVKTDGATIHDNTPSSPKLQQHRYSWNKGSSEVVIKNQEIAESNTEEPWSIPLYGGSHVGNQPVNEKTFASIPPDRESDTVKPRVQSLRISNDVVDDGMDYNVQEHVPPNSFYKNHASEKEFDSEGQGSRLEQKPFSIGGAHLPPYQGGPTAPTVVQPTLEQNLSGGKDFGGSALEPEPQIIEQPQHGHLGPPPQHKEMSLDMQGNVSTPPISQLPSNAQLKAPAFREILALKTPAERIRAFNETREQVANVNTGLAHWLAITTNEHPEHLVGLSSIERPPQGALGQKPLPFKAKLQGLRPGGAQPTQQPYYQQYLNATPQASASDSITGQTPSGNISSQGFSPSGGTGSKLSTQQVHAKGKDLLHSAGVFGGKANVAAKGFFSKGRSKFRGNSGTDKVTNQPPSPSSFSRGIQPQHQPQMDQSLPYQGASTIQPATQGASKAQPTLNQVYGPSQGLLGDVKGLNYDESQDLGLLSSSLDQECQFPDNNRDKGFSDAANQPSILDFVRPPRFSSLQGKNNLISTKKHGSTDPSNQVQTAIIGDANPIFLEATPTAESYLGSYQDPPRRQSYPSSNQTPTQAEFSRGVQDDAPSSSPSFGTQECLQTRQDFKAPTESHPTAQLIPQGISNEKPSTRKDSVPRSRYSTANNTSCGIPEGKDSKYLTLQHLSGGSTGTFHTAGSRVGLLDVSSMRDQLGVPPQTPEERLPTPVQSRTYTANLEVANQAVFRPFSFMDLPSNEYIPATSNNLQREPSTESDTSPRLTNRPPSPVSPQRSMKQRILDQQNRITPPSDNLTIGALPLDGGNDLMRRPQSYSQHFQDPNLQEHPAFRQTALATKGSELPKESYPTRMPREEAHLPRQQFTEYQLEGVGPPAIPPSENRTKSRRSSRSSAFFRNFGSSPKPEKSPSMHGSEVLHVESPTKALENNGKRSKRSSMFRTLTGRSGSDRNQLKGNVEEQATMPKSPIPRQSSTALHEKAEKANVSKDGFSGVRNKLQRASTLVVAEKNVGKKKRFSVIGSLFGRSNHEKSAPSTRSQFTQSQPEVKVQRNNLGQPMTPVRQHLNSRYPGPIRQEPDYDARPQEYVQPKIGDYYAPSHAVETGSNPAVAQATIPPSYPQSPEPPAYVQDFSLRQQNSASRAKQHGMSPPPSSSRASALLPEDRGDFVQPRQSHWVRNPALHNHNNPTYSSNHGNQPPPRTSSMQNPHQKQQSWRPNLLTGDQTSTAALPYVLSMQSSLQNQHPTINPTLQVYSDRNQAKGPQRTPSPPPPAPPPKDNQYAPSLSQTSYQTLPPSAYPTSFPITTAPSRFPAPLPNPEYSTHLQPPHPQNNHPPTPTATLSPRPHHHSLPPLQISPTVGTASRNFRDKNARWSRQMEIERGSSVSASGTGPDGPDGGARAGGGSRSFEEDDVVVMSSTSYPGQEWAPSQSERWDGD